MAFADDGLYDRWEIECRVLSSPGEMHRRSYAIESALTPIESPSKLDELKLNS